MSGFAQLSRRPLIHIAQIQGCDAILARMQEMLLGFQADLGGISDEIKHLQVYNSSACGRSSLAVLPRFIVWITQPDYIEKPKGQGRS